MSDGTGGIEPAGSYIFFYRNGNKNYELGTGYFVHKGIISAVMRAESANDRMLNIILRSK
jgi:hypothetical protein